MSSCKIVYYLGEKKEASTHLVFSELDVAVKFSDGRKKTVPFQSADYCLKGDSLTTLEISWTDQEGKNYIYCNNGLALSYLVALPGEPPYVSKVSALLQDHGENLKKERNRLPLALGCIVVALIASYLLVVSLVPIATKMIPKEWEQKIGLIAYGNYLAKEKKITSPVVVDALSTIVNRIDDHDGSDLKYDLAIIDTKLVNAFAMPGGYLVITSELIKRSESAEEVAGVLAHELTHVLEQHGMKKLLRQAGLSIIVGIFFGDSSSIIQLAELASGLEGLSFNREQEKRADEGAIKILKSAGISPSHFVSFFKMLNDVETLPLNKIPELLSTHPLNDKRMQWLSIASEPDISRPFEIDWIAVKNDLK